MTNFVPPLTVFVYMSLKTEEGYYTNSYMILILTVLTIGGGHHRHETAVSLIERAFREKWKISTIATFFMDCAHTSYALPTCHPKRDAKALMFAAITIGCTKWVLRHKCSLRKEGIRGAENGIR